MCTAIRFTAAGDYFGRNLDLEYRYEESVTVTPRHFPLAFHHLESLNTHYAMIGAATVSQNYPLYYDAVNEQGLAMAGLAFAGNAHYMPDANKADRIAPYELIPWVLGKFRSVGEALPYLSKIQIAAIPFSPQFPLTELHWILCDKEKCVAIEPLSDGLSICDDPVGILTNSPPFTYQMMNLSNYMGLSCHSLENRLTPDIPLAQYSRGMGGLGLPGDLTSPSRFVRAAFTKALSVQPNTELASVGQFFHILESVSQTEGCVKVDGKFEKTVYSSCYDMQKAIFYYTTYDNRQISAVDMHRENLDSSALVSYPMGHRQIIYKQNKRQ